MGENEEAKLGVIGKENVKSYEEGDSEEGKVTKEKSKSFHREIKRL